MAKRQRLVRDSKAQWRPTDSAFVVRTVFVGAAAEGTDLRPRAATAGRN